MKSLQFLFLISIWFSFGLDKTYAEEAPLLRSNYLTRVNTRGSSPQLERVVQLDFIDDLDGPLYKLSEVKELGERLDTMVFEIASEIERIFGQTIDETIIVRVLSPRQFDSYTTAPAWSSALFSRGEILFRIASPSTRNWQSLRRSLRHELIHRAVAEYSNNRCPVWLEEGLAQYFSGESTKHIAGTLRDGSKGLRSLSALEDDFMTMDPATVPRSYAQSIFAVRSLVNRYGFSRIGKYLKSLGVGSQKEKAFNDAFGISLKDYDAQIEDQILIWRRSGKQVL